MKKNEDEVEESIAMPVLLHRDGPTRHTASVSQSPGGALQHSYNPTQRHHPLHQHQHQQQTELQSAPLLPHSCGEAPAP